jgi:hypothetical protein
MIEINKRIAWLYWKYAMHCNCILLFVFMLLGLCLHLQAKRTFVHPGIDYTQADVDRMKAMVVAKQEPFYSSFLAMEANTYSSLSRPSRTWDGMLDNKGNKMITDFNNTVGYDGRCAVQYALLWRITDDETYAKKAVSFLNAYLGLKNASCRGTASLDNGKVYMLIETAELMRDYSGWAAEDQKAFKEMLVYPCYSSKVNMAKEICPETGKTYAYWDHATGDTLNRVTFYWNIFNGDPGRHGNQGLFGLRALMAMGIYLDNDTIYDRAYRKFMSMKHRSDDLSYPSGPSTQGSLNTSNSTEWFNYYDIISNTENGPTEDYGYNDELKYYIFDNGQMQESSRDQAHAVCGIVMAENIAHIAWTQGDDIYSQYDDLLLKGINWTWRYNYSWYNNAIAGNRYWSGEDIWEPTVESGEFRVVTDRTKRWESLKVNPYGESQSSASDGTKYWEWRRGEKAQLQTQMLMHYKVIAPTTMDSLKWIQRAYDVMTDSLHFEQGYKDTGHYYEFIGWGGLLDYRTAWMTGTGGTYINKLFVPGLPVAPCIINAVDYDFYNNSAYGNGLTYYNIGRRTDTNYRTEGEMDIAIDLDTYVLTDMKDGEWANYTFTTAKAGTYMVSVDAKVLKKNVRIGFSINNGDEIIRNVDVNNGFGLFELGKAYISSGANVIRLYVHGIDDGVELNNIIISSSTPDAEAENYEWNSRDYTPTSGFGSFLTDESSRLLTSFSYSNPITPTFTMNMSVSGYKVSGSCNYLLIHGKNLDHALFKKAVYQLSSASGDVTKSSVSGQLQTFEYHHMGEDADETFLIWKADSSSNTRNIALLSSCYTDPNGYYTLKGLDFTIYGSSLHKNVQIDDVCFYSLSGMLNAYPELKPTTLNVTNVLSDKNEKNYNLFKCDGTVVRKRIDSNDMKEILLSLPKGIYIIGGKTLLNK